MKKYSSLVSLALCLTVVVCSFNKESIEDFKARKYGNLPFGYEIKLIQKFDSFDDWSIDSPPIDIRAYVENGNLDSVHKEKSQESGYIRLGIKEYLAESNLDYKYSESRYLIDDGGNFIRSLSKDLALEMGKKYNPNIDYDDLFQERSVHDDDLAAKQGGYWYILTSSAFANGTYGKFILQHIGIGSEGYKSLSEKNPTNSEVRIESLDDVDLSEYSPYDWSNSEMESENVFKEK